MVAPSFGVSRTFDTALERLWSAFTDADELAAWGPPPGWTLERSSGVLSVGGAYRAEMRAPDGRQVWLDCELRRLDAPALVTFVLLWTGPEGESMPYPFGPNGPLRLRVEIRCARQGGGATATVNISPVEPDEREAAAFRGSFAALSLGWERALDRLERRLAV